MVEDFKKFIMRGNVIDLAVGIIMGGAFLAVVNGLIKDFITPIIGAIVGKPNFSGLTFTVHNSQFLFGDFINTIITFLSVAVAVFFFVVKPVDLLMKRAKRDGPVDPTEKNCPECLSTIPIAAKRCAFCTATI